MIAPRRPQPRRAAAPAGWPLTARQRETLAAAAACIVPVAATPEGGTVDVVALLAERLARLPATKRDDLLLAVRVFGSWWGALAATGSFRRFAKRDAAGRDQFLQACLTSRTAIFRTIAQGIRRLVLAVYYGDPRAHQSIGYLGPYHTRVPAFPWEGPAPGVSTDDEPIARGPAPQLPPPDPMPAMLPPAATAPLPATADVVVIGTGAGGGVAAARLAEAGWDVVVLEEGSLVQSDEFSEDDAEMTERLLAEQGTRTSDDLSLTMVQGVCVGGGTTVNWMIMLRAADHVFAEWTRRFGTVGMSAEQMAVAYERIEHETHTRLVPDDAHSPSNRLILDGAASLGWKARGAHVNAKGCVRSGFCTHGCRYDAKQGTLVTFIPRAVAAGARLVPDARAERIDIVEPGPRGRKRVTVTRRDPLTGRQWTETIEAPTVVVAAGAVGTPLLLQRSGLGSPAVGRYLRVHPVSGVAGVFQRSIYSAAGLPMTTLCDEFANQDGNGYGTWIETPPTHPTVMSAALQGFGATHRAVMTRFANLGVLLVLTRDGAELDASSGEVRVGRNGRTSITYRLTAPDLRHLRRGVDAAAELAFAAGASEVVSLHADPVVARRPDELAAMATRPWEPNDFSLFTAHVNGTCRLGVDPATSGADPNGQVHGAPGVYVFDGSLLPTGLGVNPQATIMAIASMLSDRLIDRRG